MLYKVNLDSNNSLFSELSLKFEVSRCRTTQFSRCFLPDQVRKRDHVPYTVFDTGTFYRFKGTLNRWLTGWVPGRVPELYLFLISAAQVLVGLRMQFMNICLSFPLGPMLMALIIKLILSSQVLF